MGYLICTSYGGRYDLQPGELPGRFESCICGGKLEFYDNQGRKRGYKPIYSHKNQSKGNGLIVKLVIFLVVFGAVAKIGSSAVMGLSETRDTVGGALEELFYL